MAFQTEQCSGEEYFQTIGKLITASTNFLREVFEDRWTVETKELLWHQTPEQGQTFINGHGSAVYKTATNLQKEKISSGNLDSWDLSILSVVLQHFGDSSKYTEENKAVRTLTQLRNKMAHHPTHKLTADEYHHHLSTLTASLTTLQFPLTKLQKMIDQIGFKSSQAAEQKLNQMYTSAGKFLQHGKILKAIKVYSDSLTIPSLLPNLVADVFEKRATCYLLKSQNRVLEDSHRQLAFQDVKQALEINARSWKAHYIIAQCYRKEDKLQQAIHHFNRALALSPSQWYMRNDLDGCRFLETMQSIQDHMNPMGMPMNIKEHKKNYNKLTGLSISEDQWIQLQLHGLKFLPGATETFRGHMYNNGWGASQSFVDAARWFHAGAQLGDPEGMYYYGKALLYGHGVFQDIDTALTYFQRAANMSPDTPGDQTKLMKNWGVANAQHLLGLVNDWGIGVTHSIPMAVKWYTQAAENGIGTACLNLGLMYSQGREGLLRNEKMAAMYWEKGLSIKTTKCGGNLIKYYLEQLEPEKAVSTFKQTKQLEDPFFMQISETQFRNSIQNCTKERKKREKEVLAFETANNLDIKGFTFKERHVRLLASKEPKIPEVVKVMEEVVATTRNNEGAKSWGGKINCDSKGNVGINVFYLREKAFAGSKLAKRLLETILCCYDLNELLDKKERFGDESNKKVVDLLYCWCTLETYVNAIYPCHAPRLQKLLDILFKTKCEKPGDEDMKIRFCYVVYILKYTVANSCNNNLAVELLKEGLKRYPNNEHYYLMLSSFYGHKNKHKKGLILVSKALQKFPKNASLLWAKAGHVRLAGDSLKYIIPAYEDYLKEAPLDDRMRPEGYYHIASEYLQTKDETERSKQICKYYQLGLEAEKEQLQCFLPYGESPIKRTMRLYAERWMPKIPSDSKNEKKNLLELKPHLKNPMRSDLILQHRTQLKENGGGSYGDKMSTMFATICPPKKTHCMPSRLTNLKPITLHEMDSTRDCIYEQKSLDLTLIDEPWIGPKWIGVIGEDGNGDVVRIRIYNVPLTNSTKNLYAFGNRISILNPYMAIAVDATNGVRVDDANCIIPLDGVESMCRFCGGEKAPMKCSKCKKATYCDRRCQKFDWKLFKHDWVCSALV